MAPDADTNRTFSHIRRPSLIPVGSLWPDWFTMRTFRLPPACASVMSLASRSICTLRAMAASTRLWKRPTASASDGPSCARTARTTQELAPAKPCWGTFGRTYGVFTCREQPAPWVSGMWQSWQLRMMPVGWFPPKRRSGYGTPSRANWLLSHSL